MPGLGVWATCTQSLPDPQISMSVWHHTPRQHGQALPCLLVPRRLGWLSTQVFNRDATSQPLCPVARAETCLTFLQVARRLSEYQLDPPQTEEDLKPVDVFISEAYEVCTDKCS